MTSRIQFECPRLNRCFLIVVARQTACSTVSGCDTVPTTMIFFTCSRFVTLSICVAEPCDKCCLHLVLRVRFACAHTHCRPRLLPSLSKSPCRDIMCTSKNSGSKHPPYLAAAYSSASFLWTPCWLLESVRPEQSVQLEQLTRSCFIKKFVSKMNEMVFYQGGDAGVEFYVSFPPLRSLS